MRKQLERGPGDAIHDATVLGFGRRIGLSAALFLDSNNVELENISDDDDNIGYRADVPTVGPIGLEVLGMGRRDSRDEVDVGVGYEARRIFIESPSGTASSCRPRSSSLSSRSSVWVKGIRGTKSAPECPVCLSVFADGEEVKQLSVCSFHAPCIDLWLNSHSNCPLCRAFIVVKRPKVIASARDEDNQQGLPDASALV